MSLLGALPPAPWPTFLAGATAPAELAPARRALYRRRGWGRRPPDGECAVCGLALARHPRCACGRLLGPGHDCPVAPGRRCRGCAERLERRGTKTARSPVAA